MSREDDGELHERMFQLGFEPTGPKRVNNYFNLRWIENIKPALEPEHLEMLENSQFRRIMKMGNHTFSVMFAHYILSRQLVTNKKRELWWLFGGVPIRFAIEDFALATGLNCSINGWRDESLSAKKKKKERSKNWLDKLFKQLFGGEQKPTTKWIHDKLLLGKKYKDPITRFRLALILLVDGILCPTSQHTNITRERVAMVEDVEAFLHYPWGRESFTITVNSIKGKKPLNYTQKTTVVAGFSHSLVLVTVCCCPDILPSKGFADGLEMAEIVERVAKMSLGVNVERARALDKGGQASVRSFLNTDRTVNGEAISFRDDEDDPLVDYMDSLIVEDHPFEPNSWQGGVKSDEVSEEIGEENPKSRGNSEDEAADDDDTSLDSEHGVTKGGVNKSSVGAGHAVSGGGVRGESHDIPGLLRSMADVYERRFDEKMAYMMKEVQTDVVRQLMKSEDKQSRLFGDLSAKFDSLLLAITAKGNIGSTSTPQAPPSQAKPISFSNTHTLEPFLQGVFGAEDSFPTPHDLDANTDLTRQKGARIVVNEPGDGSVKSPSVPSESPIVIMPTVAEKGKASKPATVEDTAVSSVDTFPSSSSVGVAEMEENVVGKVKSTEDVADKGEKSSDHVEETEVQPSFSLGLTQMALAADSVDITKTVCSTNPVVGSPPKENRYSLRAKNKPDKWSPDGPNPKKQTKNRLEKGTLNDVAKNKTRKRNDNPNLEVVKLAKRVRSIEPIVGGFSPFSPPKPQQTRAFLKVLEANKTISLYYGIEMENTHFLNILEATSFLDEAAADMLVHFIQVRRDKIPSARFDFIAPTVLSDLREQYGVFLCTKDKEKFHFSSPATLPFTSRPQWFTEVDVLCIPVVITGKKWVGIVVDLKRWCLTVLDCNDEKVGDSDLEIHFGYISVLLPYLIRNHAAVPEMREKPLEAMPITRLQPPTSSFSEGLSGIATILLLEQFACGNVKQFENLQDEDIRIVAENYAIQSFSALASPIPEE